MSLEDKVKVYLALGSNLGDRLAYLEDAIDLLRDKISGLKISKVYETEPWGFTEQPQFLNACVSGYTNLKPDQLLGFVKAIELKLGRKNRAKWHAREIDIDILFYGNQIINTTDLTIPHPYLHQRAFVLTPLNDIAADFQHPVFKQSAAELLNKLGNTDLTVFVKS